MEEKRGREWDQNDGYDPYRPRYIDSIRSSSPDFLWVEKIQKLERVINYLKKNELESKSQELELKNYTLEIDNNRVINDFRKLREKYSEVLQRNIELEEEKTKTENAMNYHIEDLKDEVQRKNSNINRLECRITELENLVVVSSKNKYPQKVVIVNSMGDNIPKNVNITNTLFIKKK